MRRSIVTATLPALAIATLVLSACSGPAVAPPPVATPKLSALAQAELLLAEVRKLDYNAPLTYTRSTRLVAVVRAFVAACRDGEPSACWRGAWLMSKVDFGYERALRGLDRELHHRVVDHCIAGDDASCRAFANPMAFHVALSDAEGIQRRKQQCDAGVGQACEAIAFTFPSPAEAEVRACRAGDWHTCLSMTLPPMSLHHTPEVIAEADAAYWTLTRAECTRRYVPACYSLALRDEVPLDTLYRAAEAGCRDGVFVDCVAYFDAKTPRALVELGRERVCELGDRCDDLAAMRTEPLEIRDALEHGCQFHRYAHECIDLAKRYLTHALPEPVPGRGEALARMLCTPEHREHRAALCTLLPAQP